jgi:hypothetical protein
LLIKSPGSKAALGHPSPSGYQANQAIHHALGSEQTVFLVDKRHHPSAIDGVRLARNSKLLRFSHNELDGLANALGEHRNSTCVVSLPSVFTVDGDIAPLDKLVSLKEEFDFILILDEAHATGCLGKTGRGIEEHFNLKGSADFLIDSALGSGRIRYNTKREISSAIFQNILNIPPLFRRPRPAAPAALSSSKAMRPNRIIRR